MKKVQVFVFAALAVLGATAADIVKDGRPVAQVVLENASKSVQLDYAAQELVLWIDRITGAKLTVVTNAAEAAKGQTRIVLGTPADSALVATFARGRAKDFARLDDNDGFIIAERDSWFGPDTIYLAAGRTKGVLNAVYRFLERNSDIIWVRPQHAMDGFGTIYGETRDFTNGIVDLVDVPSFPHHRDWVRIDEHQARLLNNVDMWYGMHQRPMMQRLYDCTDIQRSIHFDMTPFTNDFIEAFAFCDGKRQTGHDHQICYMHPKTLELFKREVSKLVAESPEVKTWFCGVGDNWSLCECDLCHQPIVLPDGKTVKYGEPAFRSTQYNLFLNKLQAYLKEKFPDFGTIRSDAYLFNATPPAFQTGRPVGPYCPYVKNHKRPVFDDEVNKHWHELAEGYKNAGMPFFSLYEYYLCSTTPYFPHAICEVAQQDYKYYHAMGLKGIYNDAGDCDGGDGAHRFDVSAIEFWTMSRLYWNVDVDIKECRREFCRRAYREAAPIMIAYHERMAENYNSDSAGCYWNDDPVSAAKHYVVEKNLADWVRTTLAEAERAAVHPGSKELIRRHLAWMDEIITKAEKAPKRLTYEVREVMGAKPDMELDGAYWKDVKALAPMTQIANANEPERARTVFKLTHDRRNCYLLAYFENKYYHEKMVAAEQGPKPKPSDQFQWDTPLEIYFDGDYAPLGTYHFFSYMYNSVLKYTGKGPTPDTDSRPWSVESKSTMIDGKPGMISLLTFPLSTIGLDISKGNKCGFQVVSGGSGYWGCSWNGGQWHSPTGFQTLRFEMK